MIGKSVGHYDITEQLGVGGMGVVYKAHDRSLKRIVALKILSAQLVANSEFKRRFLQEARAASALNHPHIVTIHEIGEADGMDFIVMEFLDGETLDKRIGKSGLTLAESIDYALQMVDALAAAHAKGIVHRDLKPSNIMIAAGNTVKVLDFGLAKVVESPQSDAVVTKSALTETGAVLGTAAYMSPEQIESGNVDTRSDIFTFGAVLYEMLSGHRAFDGNTTLAIISAVYAAEPRPLDNVPAKVGNVVRRCLQKKPEDRYQTIDEVGTVLKDIQAELVPKVNARRHGKNRWIATVASVLLVVGLGWVWRGSRNTAWAYAQVPEIRRLISTYDYTAALALSNKVRNYIPRDGDLDQLVAESSNEAEITSEPPGARVVIRAYGAPNVAWQEVGITPIKGVRIARGALEWKISKDGFQESHFVTNTLVGGAVAINRRLLDAAQAPEGMVYIPAAPRYNLSLDGLIHLTDRKVNAFYVDEFEVTNRQFKEFVDKGGYSRHEFWKEPFIKAGREVSFEVAMEQFRDKTGQPAPATWEFKEYPAGQDNHPVGGISWYEAAAYAEFAGKHLLPVSYWNRAAQPGIATHMVIPLSNFSGKGTQPVGNGALNANGTYDMAGNIREWCWNEADAGQRYTLGSSWSEPSYQYGAGIATDAFDRSAWNGVRLAKFIEQPDETELLPVKLLFSDYIHRKPASDEEYRSYLRWYQYDKTPLNAKKEASRDDRYWVRERITFDAAYNGERMIAYLFLPKNAKPPFQPVIYFPGLGAQVETESDSRLEMDVISFLMRSGRAVIYPIYKGTYERGSGSTIPRGTMNHRDSRTQQFKDFARSIDYIETRDDIDDTKLAFYGISWGGGMGAQFPALDARVKVNVLVHGGLRMDPALPEVDQFNFVSRVKIPTLMLSGDYDFTFPVETSQLPMLRLLGTPAVNKVRIPFAIGHQFLPTEFARETNKWLDRYLGPVQTTAQAQ